MTLKEFGKAAIDVALKIVGFGTPFAAMTATDKDDKVLAEVQKGALTLQDMIGVVEQLQITREAIGIGGDQAATAAGAQLALSIQKAFTDSGFKLKDDMRDKYTKACAAQAGSLADIRDCFEK